MQCSSFTEFIMRLFMVRILCKCKTELVMMWLDLALACHPLFSPKLHKSLQCDKWHGIAIRKRVTKRRIWKPKPNHSNSALKLQKILCRLGTFRTPSIQRCKTRYMYKYLGDSGCCLKM